MNKIFNISRFAKYFLYDLRNAKNRGGITVLVLGFLPVIIFAITKIISLLVNEPVNSSESVCLLYTFASIIATQIALPKKLYGHITDKSAGSQFLLVPASVFEKWLSMALIIMLIVPFTVGALLCLSNWSLSTVFPHEFALPNIDIPTEFADLNFVPIVILSWLSGIGSFALGAIVFKKSKIALTILTCFALSLLCLVVFALCNFSNPFMEYQYRAEEAIQVAGTIAQISVIFFNALILGALYLRLRTIKH